VENPFQNSGVTKRLWCAENASFRTKSACRQYIHLVCYYCQIFCKLENESLTHNVQLGYAANITSEQVHYCRF